MVYWGRLMLVDSERLELIQVVLRGEDAVNLWLGDSKKEKGSWYVTSLHVGRFGSEDAKGEADYKLIRPEDFLERVKGIELVAETMVYRPEGGYDEKQFSSWEHLAKYLGVNDLVVLSSKVPRAVADKFRYYATMKSTVSDGLREIIYAYVIASIKENAERDMFR